MFKFTASKTAGNMLGNRRTRCMCGRCRFDVVGWREFQWIKTLDMAGCARINASFLWLPATGICQIVDEKSRLRWGSGGLRLTKGME